MDWLLKSQSTQQECIPSMPFNTLSLYLASFSPSHRDAFLEVQVLLEKCVTLAAACTKAGGWSLTTFAFLALLKGNNWCYFKAQCPAVLPWQRPTRKFLILYSKLISVPLNGVADSSSAGWTATNPPPPCPSTLFADHGESEVCRLTNSLVCRLTKVLSLLIHNWML